MPDSRKQRGLSSRTLKVVGSVLIVLSLLGSLVSPTDPDFANLTIAVLCEALSWMAIPLYAWLLVEGYAHTRSRWAYGLRLLGLALISEVPYDLVTSGRVVDWTSQNPLFALVICLATLALVDVYAPESAAWRWARILGLTAAGALWIFLLHAGVRQQVMQAGILLLLLTVIFHTLARHENTMMMSAAILSACFFILPSMGVALLHYRNGSRGMTHAWQKWFFYVFYPLILLIFAGMRAAVL
ncbi:TraX family protein [Alloscardovia macacae]|nr:TraX family protein [Alloscardovia macacae]